MLRVFLVGAGGFLGSILRYASVFGPEVRLFLFIGVLGGFTTFSSFAYETFSLARDTENLAAAVNIIAQLILGLVGVWFGNTLARLM